MPAGRERAAAGLGIAIPGAGAGAWPVPRVAGLRRQRWVRRLPPVVPCLRGGKSIRCPYCGVRGRESDVTAFDFFLLLSYFLAKPLFPPTESSAV